MSQNQFSLFLMIQNKHLTKANIIDWSYIYGADKIFI